MTFLAVLGLLALACGLLLGGGRLRVPAPQSETLDQPQRQRLLRQLAELDRAAAQGLVRPATQQAERRALALELEALETVIGRHGALQAGGEQRRSLPLGAGLALLLCALALPMYFIVQGPYWQQFATRPQEGAAPRELPPEVVAMVERLERRLASEPEDVEGWKRLGRSYVVMQRWSDARGAYAEAATRAPDDLSILQGYGEIARGEPQLGAWDPAPIRQMVERLQAEAQGAPQDARAWGRLGFAYSALGQLTRAREAYEAAYRITPERTELLAALAATEYALSASEPNARAVELYRQLLERDPDHASALWVLGQVAFQGGEFARAVELWRRLQQDLEPGTPFAAGVEQALRAAQQQLRAAPSAQPGEADGPQTEVP